MKEYFEQSDIFKKYKAERLVQEQEDEENQHVDEDLNTVHHNFMQLQNRYEELLGHVHDQNLATRDLMLAQ